MPQGERKSERVELYYEDMVVAELATTEDPGQLKLEYTASWRERNDNFPISVRFPVHQPIHEGRDVYTWFLNVLPEDDALRTIGLVLNIAIIDIVDLVAALGGDLPGALTAVMKDDPREKQSPTYHVWTEARLAADIRRLPQRPLLVGDEGVQMSLAGQQAKLPVLKLDNGELALPLNGQPSTHILKPASSKLRASVENEAYCLRLAARCGLSVADAEIGRAEDISYLLVRRYDRILDGQNIRRLHQEDLCQALGYPPFQKYEWNAHIRQHGPKARDLIDVVSQGRRQGTNRLAILDAIIFNILICNIDSHAKNHSILHSREGPAMAPLYDLMCGRIYDDVTPNLPQKIADQQRGDHIYRRHWERFAKENKFAPSLMIRRVEGLAIRVLENARELAENMQEEVRIPNSLFQISEEIEARCRNVLDNLSAKE